MKKLNRYYSDCPLNHKLRKLYKLKQQINNSILDDSSKKICMSRVDAGINDCWRRSYNNEPGYEI